MHDSEWYICEGQLSLDQLREDGWDLADKYEIGSRDGLVPDEDDE